MPLVYLSCLWLAGIFLGSNLSVPAAFVLTGLTPLPLLLLTNRRRRTVVLASLGLVTLFAAAAHSHSSLQAADGSSLRFYNDRGTREVRGIITADPEVGDKGTRLNLSVTDIRLDTGWRAVKGTTLVFVPRYPAYRYGDVLTATGKLETPPRLADFDYEGYLAHQGIYSTVVYPRIEIQDRGKGFRPLEWVYTLRARLSETLGQALPEPQAALAQGIVLGLRSNIPAAVKDDFFKTGTTHILAISGMNLSVVAGILLGLGIWLFGRRHFIYIWLALGTIWLYSLLTGMQPPVVRSAVMASLFLFAELLGRQRSAIVAMSFAAAIMVGLNPRLLWDVSFQLSFLAMAGLVFVFPTLRALGRKAVAAALGQDGAMALAANIVSDSFSVTLAAIIAVWPLVAYYFGIISLVGPLATVLVLPALPGVIITGALTAVTGLIAPPAAQVMGWLAWPFLSYMVLVTGSLARSSLSFLELSAVGTGPVWTYYSGLAAVVWLGAARKNIAGPASRAAARLRAGASASFVFASRAPAKWIVPPLLVVAIALTSAAAAMPDDKLHVSFLDVGEGDAILIQKGHRQVLVDGGPSPQAIGVGLGSRMPFWDRTIDVLVSTHPHSDHLAGLVDVLRRFQVGQVLYPDLDYGSSTYGAEWLRLIGEKNIRRTVASDGQQIDLGDGAVLSVIHPPKVVSGRAESDVDNDSLVLRLSMGGFSFLLTADVAQETERELVRQRADLASTVLKVAHHGSATSTSAGFLAVVDPQIAVISVGAGNRVGHPDGSVMGRLNGRLGPGRVYRTDENGTVEFITDGNRLRVETGTGTRRGK